MNLLRQLLDTTTMTISRAAQDVCPLLEAHGVRLPASTSHFCTQEDVTKSFGPVRTKIEPTCQFPAGTQLDA